MRVAVFENEMESVRGAFEASNLLDFDNGLVIKWFTSSQSADLSKLNEFDVIFIDIDLSSRSTYDGYGLIQHIQGNSPDVLKKVIILTGNNRILESLIERGITQNKFETIIKPAVHDEISEKIKLVTP